MISYLCTTWTYVSICNKQRIYIHIYIYNIKDRAARRVKPEALATLQLIKENPEKVISALLKDAVSRKQIVKKVPSDLYRRGQHQGPVVHSWKYRTTAGQEIT